MSTDILALVGQTEDLSIQKTSDEDIAAITKTGDWLPRVQVMATTSDLVAQNKITAGVFALIHSKGNFVDLGKQINFMSLAFRSKAMRFTGKPISVFDRDDAEFKSIMIDSQRPNSSCGWGPEFMIWLPSHSVFATLFCSNPTLRNAAPDLLTVMKKGDGIYAPAPITSETHFIKGDSRSWWGARFYACSTPLPAVEDKDAWVAKYMEELAKFRNPPKKVVETEEATTARAR